MKNAESLDRAEVPEKDAESSAARWVFVALSTCGHAQSVYADVPQRGREEEVESWREEIFGDLRVGLTVKRITLEDWKINYIKTFMCGCPTVGHERDATLAALSDQHGSEGVRRTNPKDFS